MKLYHVYLDTEMAYKAQDIIISGINGKEALKNIFPLMDVKKGKGNDVNCMLTPIVIKNGKMYKAEGRNTWYKLTSNINCNDRA